MTVPLYHGHQMPTSPALSAHKGLWFERFFDQYDHNWAVMQDGKKNWINAMSGFCGDSDLLKTACQGQKSLCCMLAGQVAELKTTWHFATGLGNPHPVENGFAWHPTLGVPYLTGAAVKGLVRTWVEAGWMEFAGINEMEKKKNRHAVLYRWFGSEVVDPKDRAKLREKDFPPPVKGDCPDTKAGMFIFFDAIPVAPVKLACDVMTPHYGQWYESGESIKIIDNEPEKVPADWHSPVPVPFLVVKEASIMFSIAPRRKPRPGSEHTEITAELGKVMLALTDALQYLGAGAKTAVGYGRFEVDKEAINKHEQAAKQTKMSELSPEERMQEEVQQLKAEKIAKMFGKDYNATKSHIESKGESSWDDFVQLVKNIHNDTIQSWASATDVNKKKAFGKLSF